MDTLLQDLSSARYGPNNLDKYGSLGGKSSQGSPNVLNDSIKRPSVDSLLDELNNAQSSGPLYAVPNKPSPGGKHVTITVRETKTERMTPVNQSYPGKNELLLMNNFEILEFHFKN